MAQRLQPAIDAKVWEVMGKIEARKLKEFLGITTTDIPSMMKALLYTTWALDLEDKEVLIKKDHALITKRPLPSPEHTTQQRTQGVWMQTSPLRVPQSLCKRI